MNSRSSSCIAVVTILFALAIPIRLRPQEQVNETTTTVTANPVPLINQPLVPDAMKPGSAGFTLAVNGTGFVSGSVVKWNGSARTTTFVSRSQVKANILAADIVKPSTARVTVVNPAPGGGASNVAFFETTIPTSSIGMETSFFNAGSTPWALAVGDFNSDGKLDLVVTNLDSSDVSVFLGKGDGTFAPAVNYEVRSDPYSVAVGDFNGDGRLDLAVVDGSNSVSVLLGVGNGTFRAAVNYDTGPQPTSVAVADFNLDGKPDLVVTNFGSNSVSVLLGKGDGTFETALDYDVGTQPWAVAVGDFNHDGSFDLAVANKGSDNISILLGNGDGTFHLEDNYAVRSAPESVAVGDFNRDGKLDLAVANSDSNDVSVLLGNGDGTFRAAVNYAVTLPQSIAVGDLNGDGNLDLVVGSCCGSTTGVSLLLGRGNGTFAPALNNGCVSGAVAVGDFNSDGRLDVAGVPACGGTLGILLQAPIVALSSTSLNFSTQLIGTRSTPETVSLINTGALPSKIDSIAVSGANAPDFTQTNTCGSSLSPATSCPVKVIFKPTKIGSRTTSLTITDNAVGSPQSITLSGTGVISGLNATLSGSNLNFAVQALGTTTTDSVTLGNYGTTTLNITSISITGQNAGDFGRTTTCGSSLISGAYCEINVTFKPTQIGARTASLSISDDAPGNPQTVSLSGTGTVVKLSPNHLSFLCFPHYFPEYRCICSSRQATTLTNVGHTGLDINDITISGPFSLVNSCPATVGAGQSCPLTVNWLRADGDGEISVSDNGGGSPQTVSLSGVLDCRP